jgi:hypothetical protein
MRALAGCFKEWLRPAVGWKARVLGSSGGCRSGLWFTQLHRKCVTIDAARFRTDWYALTKHAHSLPSTIPRYVVIDGVKKYFDLRRVPPVSPRQLQLMARASVTSPVIYDEKDVAISKTTSGEKWALGVGIGKFWNACCQALDMQRTWLHRGLVARNLARCQRP